MGIVNAGQLEIYEEIPKDLLEHVEDVLFNRRPDATYRLLEFAETVKGKSGKKARTEAPHPLVCNKPLARRQLHQRSSAAAVSVL